MANDYSTIKEDRSKEPYYLIRLLPAKNVTAGIVDIGSSVYSGVFTQFNSVIKVTLNGVELSRVSGTPAVNQWSFDSGTQTLLVNKTTATGGTVVAFFSLFVTNDIVRFAKEDPGTGFGETVSYLPRVQNDANFSITQANITDGIIQISSIRLSLYNNDVFYQQYLGDTYSWFNKEVKFWHCLDDNENITEYYYGLIDSVSEQNGEILLSIRNGLTNLEKTVPTADGINPSYTSAVYHPTMPQRNLGRPIPHFAGECSPFAFSGITELPRGAYQSRVDGAVTDFAAFLSDGPQLMNRDPLQAPAGGTDNRQWVACGDFLDPSSLASLTTFAVSAINANTWQVTVSDSYHGLFVGEYVRVLNGGAFVEQFYRVVDVKDENEFTLRGVIAPGVSQQLDRYTIPCISAYDPETINQSTGGVGEGPLGEQPLLNLIPQIDYTWSTDSQGVLRVQLVDNFELNFANYFNNGLRITDGFKMTYMYKNERLIHGDAVQQVAEAVGMTVDTASIAAANAAAAIYVQYSNPDYGQLSLIFEGPENAGNYPEQGTVLLSARHIIERICATTFGYININPSGELEYGLIRSPFSSARTIGVNDFLLQTLGQELSQNYLYSDIQLFNHAGFVIKPSYSGSQFNRYNDNLRQNNTVELDQATSAEVAYLHGVQKLKRINVYTIYRDFVSALMESYFFDYDQFITYTTKGKDFEANIGDEIETDSPRTFGTSDTVDSIVLEVRKSIGSTQIKTSTARGL